ncbi:MAG: class I SAM-dependent methyltransferase [Steroidobacteraceae bacterium]
MSLENLASENLARWDAVHEARAWGRYPPEELVRFVGRTFFAANARPSLRFLEMGCGQGANLWFLMREEFTVAGIDGSAAAIRRCRERLRAEGLRTEPPHCDLRVGDFARLPWPDGSFDAVIDIESIYANAMETIRASVAEALRVLKPGAMLFAKMFGTRTSGAGTGKMIEFGTTRDPSIGPLSGHGIAHFFTDSEIRDLFVSFASLQIDWSRRGDCSGTEIFEWVIQARKQP